MLQVSIIVPVYNKATYLDDCLNSLLSQTWKETEVIVINDGSTDQSQEIIDRFARQDSRVHSLQLQHEGVSAARNKGIEAATGEFLAFVDADDIVEQDYIKSMVLAIEDADLCITGFKVWNVVRNKRESVKYRSARLSPDELSKYILEIKNPISMVVWGKLFRRRILSQYHVCFPADMSYGEDWIYNLRYLQHIQKIAILCDDEYIYRIHDKQSLTATARGKAELGEKIIAELEKLKGYLPDLACYYQMEVMGKIGIDLCCQVKGFWNRRKRFYDIVNQYNLKEKNKKYKPFSRNGLIIKWTILTNTFIPIYVLIRIAYGLR